MDGWDGLEIFCRGYLQQQFSHGLDVTPIKKHQYPLLLLLLNTNVARDMCLELYVNWNCSFLPSQTVERTVNSASGVQKKKMEKNFMRTPSLFIASR